MEKRVTLAIILCIAVFIVWNILVPQPKRPPRAPKAGEAAPKSAQTDPSGPTASKAPGETAAPGTVPAVAEKPVVVDIPDANYPDLPPVVVDTDQYRCVVSARGTVITSFRLKHFFTRAALKAGEREKEENWLEVLRDFAPGKGSLSVNLQRASGVDLSRANWRIATPLAAKDGRQEIVFERDLEDGGRIQKTLSFRDGTYAVDMTVRLTRGDGGPDAYGVEIVGPAGIVKEEDAFFTPFAAIDQGQHGNPIVRDAATHAEGTAYRRRNTPASGTAPIRYVASSDKYFISLLTLPADSSGADGLIRLKEAFTGVVINRDGLEAEAKKLKAEPATIQSRFALLETGAFYHLAFEAGQKTATAAFSLYAGPREAAAMEASGMGQFKSVLDVVNYFMCGLSWIIKPVSAACKFTLNGFYGLVHNYGIAILMLTLVVKLLMFPLTRKQMVSMHKYQQQIGKIKPELDKLTEKYKTNPKKKQQKMMELYKEHGVSPVPVAGCLPLLVNIPVFFGLFHSLRSAAELRHAPFFGWIKDLAAPDALVTFATPVPFLCTTLKAVNVLPIIMGITWFLQMWMAPKPADPQAAQQQKIMMFMPLMFMFVLYDYAAGLSLYWTFNSVLGIIEQKVIRKKFPVATPAK